MVQWLSFWLAEQEVRGSILGLAAATQRLYILLPSRDMTEISLERRKQNLYKLLHHDFNVEI